MLTLLDTFCKAGGASAGYAAAGFKVVGVDIEPQPNYPYEFVQADALEFIAEHGHKFDGITASPPCQGYTTLQKLWTHHTHSRMIGVTRDLLEKAGKPYVIENVANARSEMIDPVMLCGSSFGLRVRRHRLFETNWSLIGKRCDHGWQDASKIYKVRVSKGRKEGGFRMSGVVPVFGGCMMLREDGTSTRAYEREVCGQAMGIDWMTKPELNQAIPPAYTEYIGQQLYQLLT